MESGSSAGRLLEKYPAFRCDSKHDYAAGLAFVQGSRVDQLVDTGADGILAMVSDQLLDYMGYTASGFVCNGLQDPDMGGIGREYRCTDSQNSH
jgi:hypothetical protein